MGASVSQSGARSPHTGKPRMLMQALGEVDIAFNEWHTLLKLERSRGELDEDIPRLAHKLLGHGNGQNGVCVRWRGRLPDDQQHELEEYARSYCRVFSMMQFMIIRAQLIQLGNEVRLDFRPSQHISRTSSVEARIVRGFLNERKDVDYFVEWYEAEAEAHLDRRDSNMLPEHIAKTKRAIIERKRELCGLYTQVLGQLPSLRPQRRN